MPSYSAKLVRPLSPGCGHAVTITLNVAQVKTINRLYATGNYGNTPTEVCNRIFCEALMKYAKPL